MKRVAFYVLSPPNPQEVEGQKDSVTNHEESSVQNKKGAKKDFLAFENIIQRLVGDVSWGFHLYAHGRKDQTKRDAA